MKKEEKKLLRELKIHAKKDKINKLAQKYINQILIFMGVVIILMLIFTGYSVFNQKRQKKYSDKFYSAIAYLQKSDIPNAIQTLENIYRDKKTPKSIKYISGMRLARVQSLTGNIDDAIILYKEIYKTNKKFPFIKYLAGSSAVSLMINQKDEAKYEEISNLLDEMSNPKNPILNLSMEQKGVFEIQKGNFDVGIKILEEILQKTDLDENSKTRIELIVRAYK